MREETKLGLWIGIAFVVFVVVPVSCERGIKRATAEETEAKYAIPEEDEMKFRVESIYSFDIEIARVEWCVGDVPCESVLFHCGNDSRCVVALYDADGNERGAVVFDERGEE